MAGEWTEDLSSGVADIDGQHRELYRLVGTLREAMKQRALEQVPAILAGLRRYTAQHFAAEEAEMELARDPYREAHARLHRAFADQYFHQVRALNEAPSLSGVLELASWLSAWLREHVREVDGPMARRIRAQAAQRAAARKAPTGAGRSGGLTGSGSRPHR
ncbi:MAG: hemerythrin domain-containing protein [Anaeromyxobacter sp.]